MKYREKVRKGKRDSARERERMTNDMLDMLHLKTIIQAIY